MPARNRHSALFGDKFQRARVLTARAREIQFESLLHTGHGGMRFTQIRRELNGFQRRRSCPLGIDRLFAVACIVVVHKAIRAIASAGVGLGKFRVQLNRILECGNGSLQFFLTDALAQQQFAMQVGIERGRILVPPSSMAAAAPGNSVACNAVVTAVAISVCSASTFFRSRSYVSDHR